MDALKAIKLAPARAWRTYLGGKLLDELYGSTQAKDGHFPEEWMMSVVSARNAGREAVKDEGLSMVTGVTPPVSLKSLITANPTGFLGKEHTACFGVNTGVLVKLIDAAERLTVQAHPDRPTAKALFHTDFGKTECWHILGGRIISGQPPCVYLGFKPGVTREQWQALFERQDLPGMLDCLHRFEVHNGDTFLIEGGIPHAIGAGCFLVEIQEPTDYTIRVERTTPSGFQVADFMCHQGLGFERMFDCFTYGGFTWEETQKRWKIPPVVLREEQSSREAELIGYRNTDYFRMTELEIGASLQLDTESSFSGIYVLSGQGAICADGATQSFQKGDQFFLPAQIKKLNIRKSSDEECRILRFFGPKPAVKQKTT
ncbi:mannose-6-phosphate isomerase [Anaerosporomusa subterranea]|uniref:Phosphohexomutase n=1 Tax=Anaerosporomusa subterranea TaxID=1794912 RepID=A0A154BS33_ANASB|nr:class I mannose-6-phosphate isomerase [Anaerosporomusa subterranea]KYZ76630.1 mannose-6-phosphate isomerase [Anaerosporomusa subterranea]